MWLGVLIVTVGLNIALFGYYCVLTVKAEKNRNK